jgi:hypothetical protein
MRVKNGVDSPKYEWCMCVGPIQIIWCQMAGFFIHPQDPSTNSMARDFLEQFILTHLVNKLPLLLWNPKVHHGVHSNLPMNHIRSQLNQVHNFSTTHFNYCSIHVLYVLEVYKQKLHATRPTHHRRLPLIIITHSDSSLLNNTGMNRIKINLVLSLLLLLLLLHLPVPHLCLLLFLINLLFSFFFDFFFPTSYSFNVFFSSLSPSISFYPLYFLLFIHLTFPPLKILTRTILHSGFQSERIKTMKLMMTERQNMAEKETMSPCTASKDWVSVSLHSSKANLSGHMGAHHHHHHHHHHHLKSSSIQAVSEVTALTLCVEISVNCPN